MRRKQYLALVVIILAALSCSPALSPDALPTQAPGIIPTMIALTSDAANAMTQAALPPATQTPLATATDTNTPLPPTETATATATFFFSLPTPTITPTIKVVNPAPIGGGGGSSASTATKTPSASCQIVSQSPTDGATVKVGADFDAKWVIKNTSGVSWGIYDYDYAYLKGDILHKYAAYDFPATVASGDTVELGVDMLAPTQTGTYTTTWHLVGSNVKCNFSLTIKVVN